MPRKSCLQRGVYCEIRYNIYFTAKDMEQVGLEDMGLLVFQTRDQAGAIDTAAQIIPGAMYSNGVYMVHTNDIPAKMLGDAVYFKVYAKLADGSYVYSDIAGYHAVAYAKTVLNSSTSSTKAKALMVAMLNFGAAPQEFFNCKTDYLF